MYATNHIHMLQGLKYYTKCAVRNKFVIGGYAGFGLACLIKYIENETGTQLPVLDDLLLYTSSFILGNTKFGAGTYKAYRRMRYHIEERGTIDERFKDRFSSMYCIQTCIKMAIEEARLKNLI